MSIPNFLRSPEPNLDPDYLRRARYAYDHRERADRPIVLTTAWGPAPLDLDTALQMFERMARERLA